MTRSPAAELASVRQALTALQGDAGRLRRRLEALRARTTAALPGVPPGDRALRAELRFLASFLEQMLGEEVAELERDLVTAANLTAESLNVEELGS